MQNQPPPKVSASISISPSTHSYADSQAPNLTLTIQSHNPDHITIYADDLSPKTMLRCGAFTITDLSNGCQVKQTISTCCRIPPPRKATVSLNEHDFHNLLPNTPLSLSAPFTRIRTDNGGKPLAKHDPDYRNHRSAGCGACDVDGLEPGNSYALSLASNPRAHWNFVSWWEYGTKEQILYASTGQSQFDRRAVRYRKGPHEAIMLDCTDVKPVLFRYFE
ncbi:MAG: hypothetical protein Q9181_002169 [Wetmoreana brouardii]